ncbi:putative quinol monooxygenase [Poseidonocella sedimentorum]|uniref:Antibiotic biosynthesis monooxygenase n=1 Tax=Poseidonocella sedimentorum TaxID=871652 RepID=A0A1I6ELL2_9RHOB|nr:antibiotic biosynthesis monooxygenase [Poseidonocella sedimentorum]SFR18610.1 Antibiotic biosynthesis monooxygenase [Poseidonocella sedimentorum]
MTNDTIHVHLKVGVPSANVERFTALMDELVERSLAEPGTLLYEWYQAADGTWHILERYADAEQGDAHVKGFAENYAGRFFELAESCEATVSNNATAYIQGVLEGLAPTYITQKGGFHRF